LGRYVLLLAITAGACSTIDPGAGLALAPVTFDEGYFYCQIEPNVLQAKSCGSGDPAQGDAANGCHSRVTQFVLRPVMTPVACNGNVPSGPPPFESVQNYQTSTEQMSLDAENAPLLAWPTKKIPSHPRQVFAPESPEADLIRTWATRYSSH
jgi:hypothetical protein